MPPLRLWHLLTDPVPPWWARVSAWFALALLTLAGILIAFHDGAVAAIALTSFGFIVIPCTLLISLLKTRESRRCQFAANRWFAGLCPVCKYPRDDAAGDTCPECGRNMPEQAGLAAQRMNRSLDDADAWRSPRERRRSKSKIIHDTTPLL